MQLTGLQESTFPINLTVINSPTNMFTADDANRGFIPVFKTSSSTTDCIRIILYFSMYSPQMCLSLVTPSWEVHPEHEFKSLSRMYPLISPVASHFLAKGFVCSNCGQNNFFMRIAFHQSHQPLIPSEGSFAVYCKTLEH